MTHRFFVLFASPLLGLLAGESKAAENLPRITLVVLDAEFLADYFGHSFAGPQIGAVTGLDRTGQQNLQQPPFVRRIQAGRSTGAWLGNQGFEAPFQDGLFPAFDRREARADSIRHILKRTTFQQKTAGNSSTRLPFYVRRGSCCAHASFYALQRT